MSKNTYFGTVMIDVAGLTLTAEEREKIQHPNTGAVILFSRNYQQVEQLQTLIASIRQARQGEILIAVDQEGGRVQRFQTDFTRLPPASWYQQQPQMTESLAWLMAMELITVGVDFSFAPVLDIHYGVSSIIGDRAFSESPTQIVELAGDFIRGMRRAGMAATGKHFPGHGAVVADSHLALPIDERDLTTLLSRDIYPFQQLIAQGLAAVMPAHIVYPAVDSVPAGFSQRWLKQILRQQLGFNGVIFSDDLSMEGAAIVGDFTERAKQAQRAGCDMILVCNQPDAASKVLENLPITTDSVRQQRLASMRAKKLSLSRQQLIRSPEWQTITTELQRLNHVK